MIHTNGYCSFTNDNALVLRENRNNKTREPWLMLLARRGQDNTNTLCWGITNNGSSFARIGTQEGDIINGFVHEDPYKTRLLGQHIYICCNDSFFTNSWYPVLHDKQELESIYDFGSLTQKTRYNTILIKTESFIPNNFDALVQLCTIENSGTEDKTLTLFSVNPINIGDARDIQFSGFNTLMMGGGFFDKELNGIVWRNNYGISYKSAEHSSDENSSRTKGMFGKIALHTISEPCIAYSTKYEDFTGHYSNTMANPEAVSTQRLPCKDAEDLTSSLSVLQWSITLKAGESRQFVVSTIIGTTADYYENKNEIKSASHFFSNIENATAALKEVKDEWKKEFELTEIQIPGIPLLSHSFKWLQYQCAMVSSLNRMKSRFHSGFEYGFGFRDILQDILAVLPYDSSKVKKLIDYSSQQMFNDGSVFHNFYVSSPGNKDFHACDDPLWFIFAVCEYCKETHDFSFLNKPTAYADFGEGTIFEHCIKALNQVRSNSIDGIPIMFNADWNDDLSGYDNHLSVMTAQLLYKACKDFAQLCSHIPGEILDTSSIKPQEIIDDMENYASLISKSINEHCIDEDGSIIRLLGPGKTRLTAVGSKNTDGITFFEPVSWAGMCGQATKEQFIKASNIAEKSLRAKGGFRICQADKTLIQKQLPKDYTAWKRNAPGKKENGGMFRHLESWYIASLCKFGFGDRAFEIFYETLPYICSEKDSYTYAAERFVYPEYVSGPDSSEYGRAGHTWLTGTAPTRHKVFLESMCGIFPDYTGLRINPCIPHTWDSYFVKRTIQNTIFEITIHNPLNIQQGECFITVDGVLLKSSIIPRSFYDGRTHQVTVRIGEAHEE